MDFVAIDVETANACMSSICQIGVAAFRDGCPIEEWKSLIDPEDDFDAINTAIHGITEDDVEGAPMFPEILPELRERMEGRVVICHTHFDRVAITQALRAYDLESIDCTWLDSARVTRRTWTQLARKGYGLANICKLIGYEYEAHDALEDAKAAGIVMLAAIRESGIPLDEWLRRVDQPIFGRPSPSVAREGDPEGPLYGAVMVFTGALQLRRQDAADLASRLGCAVGVGVNKKTTYLVVGDQDVAKLAGHEKSSKHREAEELITGGHSLRILRETDFLELVAASARRVDATEAQ